MAKLAEEASEILGRLNRGDWIGDGGFCEFLARLQALGLRLDGAGYGKYAGRVRQAYDTASGAMFTARGRGRESEAVKQALAYLVILGENVEPLLRAEEFQPTADEAEAKRRLSALLTSADFLHDASSAQLARDASDGRTEAGLVGRYTEPKLREKLKITCDGRVRDWAEYKTIQQALKPQGGVR